MLCAHYDQQIVDRLIQISLRKGIEFRFNATIDRIERSEDDGSLHVAMSGCDDIEADQLLFATGRSPNMDLGLEAAGVETGGEGRRSRSMRTIAHRCRRSSRSAT